MLYATPLFRFVSTKPAQFAEEKAAAKLAAKQYKANFSAAFSTSGQEDVVKSALVEMKKCNMPVLPEAAPVSPVNPETGGVEDSPWWSVYGCSKKQAKRAAKPIADKQYCERITRMVS